MRARRKCRLTRRRIHKCRVTARTSLGGFLHVFRIERRNAILPHRNDALSHTGVQRRGVANISGMDRTVRDAVASKRVRGEGMARRPNGAVGVVCPRCGMLAARIIGRSESLPVIYLTCED